MNARATRRGIPAAVKWGGLVALAWATLTILTGGASAHADEQSDGPLDGLTSIVGETVSTVTTPVVTQVVAPVVTHVAAPVVQAVVAPVQQVAPVVVATVTQAVASVPVVGPATAPVVEAVSHTAQGVATPVTDALTGAPVAQLTDPILDAVSGLPILGGVLDNLGTRDLVDQVIGVVDDAAGVIGGVTEETVPPILEALDPDVLGAGGPNEPGAPDAGSLASLVAAATASGASDSGNVPALSTQPVAPANTSTVVIGERGAPESTPGAPPGTPAAPTSSAGPGGGSSSAHARLSDAMAPPLRAWERASGASDDALPASPVADTDVSPD